MSEELQPDAPESFESEINRLISDLCTKLGDGKSRWYYDDESEILYIELESLSELSEDVIQKEAGPILEACELDFEEIILLPLTR